MEYINTENVNGLTKIVLNRPKKFNSFCKKMAFELQEVLDNCKKDNSVRCVFITSVGKAFCAGQDLGEAIEDNGIELEEIVKKHYNPIIIKIRELKKPVLCAVNGVAAGAGVSIALACDITVAKKSANFIQAFSKIGLIPDSGSTYFLPRTIGLQKSMGLMLLGKPVSATEAKEIGMIYDVFEDEIFEESAQKLAEKLSIMPTKGLWLTKKLLNETFKNNLETQLNREAEEQIKAGKTEDFNEGVNAFLEKRKANFKGK